MHETAEPSDRPPLAGTELARAYDDLRVELIVLHSARDKDSQAIEEVTSRLGALEHALKTGDTASGPLEESCSSET